MRRGVTLLEILICILILSVAMLGLLALFGAANASLRKAKIADVSAIAGESAIAAFDAEGMREPGRWIYWDATNSATAPVPQDFQQSTSPFFGYSFCIDPRGFERNRIDDATSGVNNSGRWAHFPGVPATAAPNAARMHRLTLHNGLPSNRMSFIQAEKVFSIADELIYERPDDNSLPAVQRYTQPSGNAGVRQEEGRTTWFATLSPKLDRVQAGSVATLSDEYTLSIVVCRDRGRDSLLVPNATGDRPWPEWTAKVLAADFHSSGIGGGEVTVTTNDPAQDPTFNQSQYLDLRRGSWIMLGRTLPGSKSAIQHFVWYRVSDAAETVPSGNRWSQDVTLVGPDWPADIDGDGTPEECDVVITPSTVHVYERTIRLD